MNLRRSLTLSILMMLLVGTVPAEALTVPGKGTERVRLILTFDQAVGAGDISNIARYGGTLGRQFSLIPAVSIEVPAAAVPFLQRLPRLSSIQEDMRVEAFLQQSVPQIRADTVHSAGTTGNGVKICIVDTGVDDSHPALPALIAERDFVNGDMDAFDDNGHGTHVAGITASRNSTYKGVAPGASLLAAKVLAANGSGYESDVIAGIEWCVAQGATVINLSLGGGLYSGTCDGLALSQAVNAAVDQGAVVAVASGNSGNVSKISAPACASKVIAVGAVTKADQIASYSNRGSELDVVAPGSSITSTIPGGFFTAYSGTSMATPHVAGAAALLLQAAPALTPGQVRTILQETALDLGSPGFDTTFGYGRINVAAAVARAKSGPPPTPKTVFADDFANFNNWTESNEFDWNVEFPSEKAVPGKPTGNLVAHADDCDSTPGCILTLTNPLDLSTAQSATLRFWRFVDRSLDPGEYLRVELFNGSLWTKVAEWGHGYGDDDTWHEETVNLSAYLVSGFRVRFVSKENSSFENTEVDDVRIEAYIPAGNSAPTANAGPDQTLADSDGTGSETALLQGSGSDSDGTVVGYEWREGTTVLGSTAAITPNLAVGTHTLTLTVTDNEGATGSDTVVISVQANAPPTADAGPDQTVPDTDDSGAETVILSGSASSDTDGTIVRYTWKEGTTLLGTGTSITPSLALGTHTITLTVTDNGGATDTDVVVVTVLSNLPPVSNAGPDQAVKDSDGDGSEIVTLNGSASLDSDGTIVSYLWQEGATALGTGQSLTLPLGVGAHTITLTVTDDDGATDDDTVVITVAPNAAPTANAGPDQTVTDSDVNGSETVTLNGSASSDSDGTIISYEWKEGTTTLGTTISITPTFGVGTHTLTLVVTDNGGATGTDTVVVTVNAGSVTPQTIFSDTFESGFAQWVKSGNPGWNPERAKELMVPGHSFSNTVAHADGCRTTCFLTNATPLNLSGKSAATLTFWRFADDSLDAGEFLRVEVFDGSAWRTLATWTDGSGDDNIWHLESFNLTPYLNAALQIRFSALMSSSLEEGEMDDVTITAKP